MTSGEFMFEIHLSSYVTLFGLKSDEMTELIIIISFPLSGCITTEQAERENLCDLLLVLQVLLVLWNIFYFAYGIKLLLGSCALIFGAVGLAGVFWAVVSLFNVNMRLYHLFWAAKI